MSGFYELRCIDHTGMYAYYYFYSSRAIRNPAGALRSGYAPDAMRLVVDDRKDNPIGIRLMHNIFEYFYNKYFKKYFSLGYRVDWEKEIKKI